MSFTRWLRNLRSTLGLSETPRKQRRPSRRVATHRPQLEDLEDRRVLSFNSPVLYPAGDYPVAVVTGYLNNDTVLDLAVANPTSSTVSVLLGNANGSFQTALTTATGSNPLSLAVGDFDEDGTLDLTTANAGGGVSVLLGNGDGTFQPASHLSVYGTPASVAVGDFNADGNLDLGATSNVLYPGSWGYYGYYPGFSISHANVLLGTGTGSFAASVASYLGYGHHTSAAVADFNRDGKQDFATVNVDHGTVSVLLGTAAGLGTPTDFNTGFYPRAVTVGDFTGDGILDLATAGQTVDILPGYGNGSFQPVTRQNVDPIAVAAADFNGDGKLDLVTADFGSTVTVLVGTGTGTLRPPINVVTGATGAAGVAVGDFNGDGRPDVASANASSDNLSVLLNDGTWLSADAPSVLIGDANVTEGNFGTVNAEFTVNLSVATSQTVTVTYTTADGSATLAGEDYQAKTDTLVFAPGDTTQTFSVLVNGDRLAEVSEFFLVRVTEATNAFVSNTTGIGRIADNEPRVSIDYGPVYVTEGNSGTTEAVFTVRLANAYDEPVSVNYSTAEGDTEWWSWSWYYEPPAATAGSDFRAVTVGTLTFAPGETERTIPITIHGDRLGEFDEYFSLNLTDSPDAAIDSAHAVGVIVNDEPIASVSGGGTVTEGNSGTMAVSFTISLSAPATDLVTVTYATNDGTATAAGEDYRGKTETVTFAVGESSKTVMVLVNGDRLAEYDEYFSISLTGATGAAIDSYSTGYATIVDNEPRLRINSASITEGNSGTKVMTFTVTHSVAYDQAVTVNFATQDYSATAGSDYIAKSGTLTFAPGQTTRTFTVTIKGDKQKEADESFYVLLSGASSNALIDDAYGWANILNDDGRPRRR